MNYKVKIKYTDGSFIRKEFKSLEEMNLFIYLEGDHVQSVERERA